MSRRPSPNVFRSYRGPSKLELQAQVDRQLQDNATRELLVIAGLAPLVGVEDAEVVL